MLHDAQAWRALELVHQFEVARVLVGRETLAEYGIEAAPGVIPDTVRLPDKKELEDMIGRIPGGRGFRDEAYPGFIHPIMVLIFALAFLEESEELG